jgi:hypothetical protein
MRGVCDEFEFGSCSLTRLVVGKVGLTIRKFGGGVRLWRVGVLGLYFARTDSRKQLTHHFLGTNGQSAIRSRVKM